jgi:hypothetical protein
MLLHFGTITKSFTDEKESGGRTSSTLVERLGSALMSSRRIEIRDN